MQVKVTVEIDLVRWARRYGEDTADGAISSAQERIAAILGNDVTLRDAGAKVTIDNVFP